MEVSLSIKEIRDLVNPLRELGALARDSVSGIGTLEEAIEGDLSFMSASKYRSQLLETKASVVLVPENCEVAPRAGQVFLKVEHASLALARVCEYVEHRNCPKLPGGIHPSAVVATDSTISDSAHIGANCVVESGARIEDGCQIAPGCFVGEYVVLGSDSKLFPNVSVLRDTIVGARARIHSGVVLGSDGFGYEQTSDGIVKIPQIGRIEIGDDVEIGANTTIDRGRFGPTRIGSGTKIDNQVQIAHNVQIGQNCRICAQVGISGSTTIEDFVIFGGRAGTSDHLTIGKGAMLAGCSVAFGNLEGGAAYGGVPAAPLRAYQRIAVLNRKLPDLFERLKRLEAHLTLD